MRARPAPSLRAALGGALALLSLGCASQAAPSKTPAPAPFSGPVTPASVGAPAPDFVLPDPDGTLVRLSDHAGKVVVLEWFNPECPFVVNAHEQGPLVDMPRDWDAKGVVWLPVNSNAPGAQGSDPDRNRKAQGEYGLPRPVLLDPTGAVGKAYGAKTTPQIYIVEPGGTLVYSGGLDNAPLGEPQGGTLQPFADDAIRTVVGGGTPAAGRTKPYGCSVKYGG